MGGITRRGLLVAGMSGAACAGTGLGRAAAGLADAPHDPAARLDDMIRIMGRTDGGVAVRWTRGVLSGIVEQRTTQLLGVSQQIFTRHRRTADGGFDAAYLELVYFTDLASGEVEDRWRNPYTGRHVALPAQVLGPTRLRIPPSLTVINQPFALPGVENKHWLEPFEFAGDDVSFNERIDSYVPAMSEAGAPLVFHEVFSFHASRKALSDRASSYVPATVHKVNVISWRNWMDMKGVNGVTMSHASGRIVRSLADIPADLAEKNGRYFASVVENLDENLAL